MTALLLLLTACVTGTSNVGGDGDAADSGGDSVGDSGRDSGADTAEGDLSAYVADVALSVHPEVATILVVDWTQLADADATWLSWDLDGDTYTSPETPRSAGASREMALGLPADTTVTLTLHVRDGDREGALALGAATTGPLPTDLVSPTLVTWDPGAALDARWFLTSVNAGEYDFYGPCYVVLLDRSARVVWYRLVSDHRLTLFPRVARSGDHLVWEASTYYVGPDVLNGLVRATLDLTREDEIELDHLGFTWDELDDGSILYDYDEDGYQYHLARRWPDGTVDRIWSCWPWMSAYRTDHWACAPNTVLWSPERGTVLWSMFVSGTVVEIDLATGEQLRHFGQLPDGWAFDPADVTFEYQHFPNWTPDGTLLTSTHVPGEDGVQRVRELDLDEADEVVRQVWTWSPDAGHYAQYAGEAQRLENGATLVGFGTAGVVQEVAEGGDVAWEISWSGRLLGHFTPLTDLYALTEGR